MSFISARNSSIIAIDDSTLDLILSPLVRYFVAFYNTFVVTFGIFGNGFVLFAMIKFNAIRMDNASLILIKDLALSDIFATIVYYFPLTVTVWANRWVLGDAWCFIMVFGYFPPIINEILTLTMMTCCKLYIIRNPFTHFPTSHLRFVILIKWLVALGPYGYLSISPHEVHFSPESMGCSTSAFVDPTIVYVAAILSVFFVMLPLFIMVTGNINLLYIATRKSLVQSTANKSSRKAMLTVSIVCWTFLLSYTPFLIRTVLVAGGFDVPQWFVVLQAESFSLGFILNPVIYAATNRSFAQFLKSRFRKASFVGSTTMSTRVLSQSAVVALPPMATPYTQRLSPLTVQSSKTHDLGSEHKSLDSDEGSVDIN